MPDTQDSSKNYKRHGARYKARRRAADLLYEAEQRDTDPVALVAERIDLARDQDNQVAPIADYTKIIVAGVAAELDHLDMLIASHLAEDWELERITALDRAVLRVGLWELLWNPEVPIATAVSDAVEIASQYSTDNSPAYINALLDAIAKNIDEQRDRALNPEAYAEAAEPAADEPAADDIAAAELDDAVRTADDELAPWDAVDAALEEGTQQEGTQEDAPQDAPSDAPASAPWDEENSES